jgi:hypothetical protein
VRTFSLRSESLASVIRGGVRPDDHGLQLRDLLESAFQGERAVLEWLHSPVPAFRGRSPLSLLKEGKLDELIEAMATLDAGSVV